MPVIRDLLANRWVRYSLTILLLLLVVLKVQPQHLGSAALSARPQYLLVALALTIPFLYLKSLRWYLMLRAAHIHVDLSEAIISLVGGMGLALLTPARLGELVRVAYLRDPQKLKIGGLVMIDKGFDVLVLSGLSVAGAWVLLGAWAGLGLTGLTLIGLAVVYEPRPLHSGLRRISAGLPFGPRLLRVWESLESLNPMSTTVFVVLTLLSFVLVLLQFGVILLSWRAWSPDIVLLTFPLVVLTNVLPITIGGLGVREGAAVLLLGHYGVPAGDAAVAAFLMFAINTALPGIAGALLLPAVSLGKPAARSLDHP